MIGALSDMGHDMKVHLNVPGSLMGINRHVQTVLQRIDEWRTGQDVEHFYLAHNMVSGGGGYELTFYRLLPLDGAWASQHSEAKWPNRCLPLVGIPSSQMFVKLLEQYLFVSLFRAFAQSLAGEHAARLMAMQAAEKNILETQDELSAQFREVRQNNITNELLDIVSGFEALGGETPN